MNYGVGLSVYEGGQVWVEDPVSEGCDKQAWQVTKHGEASRSGRLLIRRRTMAEVDPFRLHGTEPYVGERIVISAFTPEAGCNISLGMRKHLQKLGFPLHAPGDSSQGRLEINAAQLQSYPGVEPATANAEAHSTNTASTQSASSPNAQLCALRPPFTQPPMSSREWGFGESPKLPPGSWYFRHSGMLRRGMRGL